MSATASFFLTVLPLASRVLEGGFDVRTSMVITVFLTGSCRFVIPPLMRRARWAFPAGLMVWCLPCGTAFLGTG